MRNNLPQTKEYVINFDEYWSIGTHWIALCVNGDNVIYFDRFVPERIPKEIKNFIGNKNFTTSIFRIQTYGSIMYGFFCIGFIDFMLKGRSLLEYTNLFLPFDYEKMAR